MTGEEEIEEGKERPSKSQNFQAWVLSLSAGVGICFQLAWSAWQDLEVEDCVINVIRFDYSVPLAHFPPLP